MSIRKIGEQSNQTGNVRQIGQSNQEQTTPPRQSFGAATRVFGKRYTPQKRDLDNFEFAFDENTNNNQVDSRSSISTEPLPSNVSDRDKAPTDFIKEVAQGTARDLGGLGASGLRTITLGNYEAPNPSETEAGRTIYGKDTEELSNAATSREFRGIFSDVERGDESKGVWKVLDPLIGFAIASLDAFGAGKADEAVEYTLKAGDDVLDGLVNAMRGSADDIAQMSNRSEIEDFIRNSDVVVDNDDVAKLAKKIQRANSRDEVLEETGKFAGYTKADNLARSAKSNSQEAFEDLSKASSNDEVLNILSRSDNQIDQLFSQSVADDVISQLSRTKNIDEVQDVLRDGAVRSSADNIARSTDSVTPNLTDEGSEVSTTLNTQRMLPGEQAVRGDDFFMSPADEAGKWGPEARQRADVRKVRRQRERVAQEQRGARIKTSKEILKRRRNVVSDLRDRFGLTDSELRSITNNRDIRLMDNYEFKRFKDNISQKAVEKADTRQAKAELMDLMRRKEFERVENYRRVKGYPPISKMSAEQLRDYAETLEDFSEGDVFLTQRQLEVVDRSDDLEGVRTFREARERFAKLYNEQTGKNIKPDELDNITAGEWEKMMGDATLSQQNPLFEAVIPKVHSHLLSGERRFLEIQEKANELAKAANKSRNRGVLGSAKQAVIPQHEEIVRYLEAPPGEKAAFAEELTKEELNYANFIEQYYSGFYDHLVKINELHGSRFIDQYFTHTRKHFLESLSDDGLISAFRTMWKQHKDDRMVAQIIDDDTGNILAKSKFFANTLRRTGDIDPSKNVTRVFMNYVRMAERKKALDQILPEVDIYTQAMSPRNLTEKGLEMDRSLKNLMNEYLNNKKGRRSSMGGLVPQNGARDTFLRMSNSLVSIRDLGFSIPGSAVASLGDQMATIQALGPVKYVKAWKRRAWDTGLKRMATDNGSKILKNSEEFLGRNAWKEVADADMQFGERIAQIMFGGFSQASVEANKIFLLGNVTKAEMKAGKLSADRLAQLRLESARWRDMGREVKSIFGSTSVGEAMTKYIGWAIPIFRTGTNNLAKTLLKTGKGAKNLSGSEIKSGLTAQEAKETYRLIGNVAFAYMVGDYLLSEEEDDSFVGQITWRVRREINTLLQGMTPSTFLGPARIYTFYNDLITNIETLIKLEEYKTDTKWGDPGELKGLKGLERQLTPAALRQFGVGGGQDDGNPWNDGGGGSNNPWESGGSATNPWD